MINFDSMSTSLKLLYVKYKNLFLRKKSSQPRVVLGLARVEKGEVTHTVQHQKATSFLLRTTVEPSVQIRGPNWRHENLSHQKGFITRLLNGASQEMKVKLNASQLLKFYQVKQQKENSIKNSAEKTLKKTCNLMKSETFR